MVQKNKKK